MVQEEIVKEMNGVAGSEGGEFRLSSSLSTPTPAHTVSV